MYGCDVIHVSAFETLFIQSSWLANTKKNKSGENFCIMCTKGISHRGFILRGRANINYIYYNDQNTLEIPFKLNIPNFASTITLSKKSNYFILTFQFCSFYLKFLKLSIVINNCLY